MPASSAMLASLRLSGQLPDQRSGTSVTARPDEQFAPNKPIFSLFPAWVIMRSRVDMSATGIGSSPFLHLQTACNVEMVGSLRLDLRQ